MKASITPHTSYVITIDGKEYNDFEKKSEWEGMIKFSGHEGTLIVEKSETDMPNIFDVLFKESDDEEPFEVNVVKASPSLLGLKPEEI